MMRAPPSFPAFVRVHDVSRRGPQMDACKSLMLALVVFFVVSVLCSKQGRQMPSMISQGVSTMKAHFSQQVTKATGDAHAPCPLGSKVTNLTACSKDNGQCTDLKNIDDDYKKKNLSDIVKFNKENPEAMFIIYASWCQHCHNAMPHFVDASKRSPLKFAAINGDLIPEKALTELGVTHYPYIVKTSPNGNSVLKDTPNTDAIVAHSKKQSQPLDQYF